MDYDDNDFEGRQPLIAGEGSSKFSSVLHPYVLPKFDFDDGFQGHLRFDSLVENEVFLGIPSQVDNHWIEAFPRGSSAPESCSFSRHNNVWLEATSSESVEMLLKSVGQEEIVGGETIVEESDACDGGDLIKWIDPQLQKDHQDKHLKDPGSLFLSDGCQEHTNDVEGTSPSLEAVVSAHESSFALDPNSSSGMSEVVVTENNVGFERNSDDVAQIEVGSTVNESSDNTMETEPYGSEMQIDEMESSARDNNASIEGSNTGEFDHKLTSVTFENAFQSSTDGDKEIEEHHVLNEEVVDAVDKLTQGIAVETGNHNSVNEPRSLKTDSIEQNKIEAATSDLQGVPSLALTGSHGVQMTEGCSKIPCLLDAAKAIEPQLVDLSDSTEVVGGTVGSLQESLTLINEGNCNIHRKFIGVTTTSEDIRDCSELKVDQRPDGASGSSEAKDCLQGSVKLDSHASGTESEAPIVSGVEDRLSDGQRDGSCSKYVRDPATSTFSSCSTEFLGGNHTIETVEDLGDASSAVHKEDAKSETGLIQNDRGGSSPIDQLSAQDVTVSEKASIMLKNNNNSDSDFVKSLRCNDKVGPSSEIECAEVRDETVHGFESLNIERNKPALDVLSGSTNLGFQDSVDDAPPSQIVATLDQGTNLLDKNYKTGNEGLAESNLLILKEGLGEQSGLGPLMLLERDKVVHLSPVAESWNSASGCERSGELLNKQVDQPLSIVQSSNKVSGIEQAIDDIKNNQDFAKKLKLCATACNSAVKDGGDGEGLVLQELDAEIDVDITSLKVAGSVKSICGKNILPDCTVLSENEKDEVEAKGSTSKSSPLSEVTTQSTQVLGAGDGSLLSLEVDASAGLLEKQTTTDGESITPTQVCPPQMIAGKCPLRTSCKETEILLEPSHESPQDHICGMNSAPDCLVLSENGKDEVEAEETEILLEPSHESPQAHISGMNSIPDCTVLSENVRDEVEARGSMSKSSPLSEVTTQSTQVSVAGDESILVCEVDPSAGLLEKQTIKDGESIPPAQVCPHLIAGKHPLTPSHKETEILMETSHESPQEHIIGKNSAPDCTELSENEKDEVEAKGSTSKSSPLSEVTILSTQVLGAGDGRILSFEVDPSTGSLEKQTTKDGESISPTQVCPPHMIAGKLPPIPSHKETLELSHESPQEHNGDASAGSIKPTCGNITVSSCTVLCGSEKNQEGSKGSTGKSIPLSEVTIQPYPTITGNNEEKDDSSLNSKFHPPAVLSEKQAIKLGQSITTKQDCEPHTMEGSPKTPRASRKFSEMPVEISHQSSEEHYGETVCGSSKDTLERKRKRALGGRSSETESSSKRRNHLKKTTPSKQPKKEDKLCNVSVGSQLSNQLVQVEGLKPYATVACSSIVTRAVVSAPTSNFPDLNTAAPPLLFQQPFTDTQQVQLRAQIIVYGSLIQGAAPDEAFMVSAFGASDGGRSIWEPSWHACLKRVKCQKSHTNHLETPAKPLSGAGTSNKSTKQEGRQSKVSASPSPLGRAGSKGAASAALNSIIPLSSPLWNMSTPDVLKSRQPRSGLNYLQSVSPLHPFQTPTHSLLDNASRLSQTSSPGSWISSAKTSVFDSSVQFPVLPMEAVKLTPVKGLSSCVSHETKHASHVHEVHSTTPSFLSMNTSSDDMKRTVVSRGPVSTNQKARERKNVIVSKDPRQFSLLAHPRTESVSIPVVTCHLSTSVVVSTPNSFVSKSNTNKIVTTVATASSTDHLKHGEHKNVQEVDIAVDASNTVEESKQQAEDAAALAAAALSHCQSVWSQLDKHMNSDLVADAEAKLASAAVAVAAAASVAKAAAAAAKIASNIALQAKLMADEVSQLTKTSNPAQVSATSFPEVSGNLGKATPVSNLKCGNVSNNTSSIIGAAREAARSRIEAASVVLKHAENVDAIVKAAELAAEAVTQAGKIVAMGDPLSLNELIAAGPDGYWRVPLLSSEQGVKSTSDNGLGAKAGSNEGRSLPRKQVGEDPSENGNTIACSFSPRSRKTFSNSLNDCRSKVEGAPSSLTNSEKDFQGKMIGKDNLAKTTGFIPESECGSGSASGTVRDENESGLRTWNYKGIKEGCLVEVYRDGDKEKAAWFSASVLSLKDGKAFVCYTELQADEDSGKLKEWVVIEDQAATSAPRIRIAHPMTTIRFEGTRKRRRDAMANYAWSVGDRVDVWTQSCWREAVITEKNRQEETSLTVHFQAEGEISVVKAWYLRPTLIWRNGQWVEWSISKGKDPSYQGEDTPKEKRKKLCVPAVEGVEKDKTSRSLELKDFVKPDRTCLLPLSANEKIYNVGKHIVDQHRPTARGALRTGLKKEGSGVIFGVPKPGNKPKFMDVSKPHVAERKSTTIKSNDSTKFAKCSTPQGAGPGGWRNQTRPVTKMNSGKLAPCRNTSAAEVKRKLNNDDMGSSTSELSEPRRSNRKIKPTSRLLEGIQSSLMISKIPPASHDNKSHRSQK